MKEAVEPSEQSSSAQTDGGARLYVWLYDADGIDPDFLAVIDAEPASDSYGQVLTTVPAGEVRGGAHHTSLVMPSSGILFANYFLGNHSYIFDTQVGTGPALTGSFGNIGEYSFAHWIDELDTNECSGFVEVQDHLRFDALTLMNLLAVLTRQIEICDLSLSAPVFAQKFHSSFQRTPMDYVRDVRLRRAAQLLHRGELSVEEVATKVGFSSRSHFSRIFTEQFGSSPVKYRAGMN